MIKTIDGDVRNPIGTGNKLICHCTNDQVRMGSGVALALLQKWPSVRSEYMRWGKGEFGKFALGNIQIVWVEEDIAVVNMVGQHDTVVKDGIPPIRYDAMRNCLNKVCTVAKKFNATVHCPEKIGCCRAGGDWNKITQLIKEELSDKNIDITIYKFNQA